MKYYTGLDVSLKETFVGIIDESGKIISECSVESDVYAEGEAHLQPPNQHGHQGCLPHVMPQ
jgi:hypothetical protein